MLAPRWWTLLAAATSLLVAAPARAQGRARPDPEAVRSQTAAALSQLDAYLSGIGFAQLEKRAATVAALETPEDAERRQTEVRRKVLELVGGLPPSSGPVVPRRFGTVQEDGFHVENLAYESTPGYWVTANVYVPEGPGPFPAMVIAPGHGAGKEWQFGFGALFARAGILTLSIDAMGQGERLQHFDPELGTSKIEPMGEHEHANQSALLIGQHVARYWFADGIRGVDYLTGREDVDPDRVGTFGCSGGGTAAAYLAAMDERIRVAAIASFITSFRELLPERGPQDAEQTLPRFVASGLDFADWVELAAPRPVAIVAFEKDFFPIAGARWTYEEAKRFYTLNGAAGNVRLIVGEGGHCALGPVMPEVLGFLVEHLKGTGAPVPTFERARPRDPDALTVTASGQISTSIGGKTIEDLAREDAARLTNPGTVLRSAAEVPSLEARVREDARRLAGIVAVPGTGVEATTAPHDGAPPEGYQLEDVTLESEPGIALSGLIAVPNGTGPHRAVLWMDAAPLATTAASPDLARLARSGRVVLAFHPRGVLGEPPPDPDRLALGQYMTPLLRAIVVGRTLVGMRVDDTVRAIDWLLSRPDVDRSSVTVYGTGAQGIVALHAAALDPRISGVVVERTLLSYRMALEAGLHKNLSEVLIPGVLRHYDTLDLVQAIRPRAVTLVNPASPMGRRLRSRELLVTLEPVLETDRLLGTPGRVRLQRREWGDPVPIE